jgi:hypothetical protein
MAYKVKPVEGQDYEGRQWGYQIWCLPDDSDQHSFEPFPEWNVQTGGTGPCWNISQVGDDEGAPMHVCSLEDLIAALEALRDSEADAAHRKRWE